MSIQGDIASLEPGQEVILFDLDMSPVGGDLARFHAGLNGLQKPLVWQGNTYLPFPIEASGFEVSTGNKLPRPTITVANIDGSITALVLDFDDLINSKLTRRRTLAKYLDAVNFPGGVNPAADPTQELPQDIYYVTRKISEDEVSVVFELASACDLVGVRIPRRQVNARTCTAIYKSADCGYVPGPMFDASGNPVTDPLLDDCSHQLETGCKLRFYGKAGTKRGVVLPLNAFPGAGTGAGIASS